MTADISPDGKRIVGNEDSDAAVLGRSERGSQKESLGASVQRSGDDDVSEVGQPARWEDEQAGEWDEDDQEGRIDDLYPFKPSERELIDQIDKTIRKHMLAADPASLKEIAAFLYALERLPYATPEVSLDLALMSRVDESLSYVSVELDGRVFRLSAGGSIYSPDVGGDSYSGPAIEIEVGGFRSGTTQEIEEWLDQFVSADGRLEIQGYADADLTESAPIDGWERLDRYWANRWEDDDDY